MRIWHFAHVSCQETWGAMGSSDLLWDLPVSCAGCLSSEILVRNLFLVGIWSLENSLQKPKINKQNLKLAMLHCTISLAHPYARLYQDSFKNLQCADVEESRIDSFTSLQFLWQEISVWHLITTLTSRRRCRASGTVAYFWIDLPRRHQFRRRCENVEEG